VILFSFGSLVSTTLLPRHVKLELFKAFSHFPNHTVLWKYDEINEEDAELLSHAPNIHTVKWLPQVDLLNDGRVKVFISHMGLNSYLETSHAGVPMISIPLLIDQFYNAGCAERIGTGIQMAKSTFSAESLVKALNTMLDEGSSYQLRAKEVGRLLSKRPEKPATTFVSHVEYAAEFPSLGAELLQMASAGMSSWKYFCLDVVAALLGIMGIMGVVVFVIIRCVVRNRRASSRPTEGRKIKRS